MSNYLRIYYDAYKNRLYSVENENGKRFKVDFHPKFKYYIPDPTHYSEIKDIYGNPVILQESEERSGMKEVASCMKTCESDLSQDIKYLQEKYKGQTLKVNINDFQIATIDIEVQSEVFPEPEDANYPINLISVHYSKENKVYTFGLYPYTGNSEAVENFHYCADEKTMIERFIKHFRKKGVDIISGWANRTFDIPYIVNRCKKLKIEASLSPLNFYRKKRWSGYHIDESEGYEIPGIACLDGIDLFKNFEREKRVSYSLQSIGMEVAGEGKKDYEGTINNAWKVNWNGFVEYNVQDVILVKKIEDVKKYIELAIRLCYETLVPFERVFSTISLIEGYVIKVLHEQNIVLPDLDFKEKKEKFDGAHVFANMGHYKYCISYDVESLYPHMVLMHNISPETLKLNDSKYGKTPLSEYKTWELANGRKEYGGIFYDKSKKGVLPEIVGRVLTQRKKFKQKMFIADAIENNRILDKYDPKLIEEVKSDGENSKYYDEQQYVFKIFANSIFGAAGCEYFHLYNIHNAVSITLCGQDLIKYLYNNFDKYMIQKYGLNNPLSVQGDTDSVYLCFDEFLQKQGITFSSNQEFYDWANEFDKTFITPFFKKILDIYAKNYDVEQVINFKREKIINQRIVTAKKKYVDEIIADEDKLFIDKPKLKVTGIEIVRTDTPLFCKDKLEDAVKSFFDTKFKDKQLVIEHIRKIKNDFLSSPISKIAIPKGVSEYTKYAQNTDEYIQNGLRYPSSCPIHVRASINYNYLISKFKLPLVPITNGTKVKYIHTLPNNLINQDIVAFINEWPDEFNKIFKIDYDRQFNRTFTAVLQRFFDVLNWGDLNLEESVLAEFMEF
jgi:DNA polymerase elongation subunit (family B)